MPVSLGMYGMTAWPKGRLACTSKVKYFFRFLMIITKNGSLMPSVFLGSAGHVIYVVLWGGKNNAGTTFQHYSKKKLGNYLNYFIRISENI